MTIPFTQYLRPNGHAIPISIERPVEVEQMAQRFLDAGGRYEAEVLTTGQVSITAVMIVDGEEQDIEGVITSNGPELLQAVDELVRRSEQYAC